MLDAFALGTMGDEICGVRHVSTPSVQWSAERKAEISHDKLDGASDSLKNRLLLIICV